MEPKSAQVCSCLYQTKANFWLNLILITFMNYRPCTLKDTSALSDRTLSDGYIYILSNVHFVFSERCHYTISKDFSALSGRYICTVSKVYLACEKFKLYCLKGTCALSENVCLHYLKFLFELSTLRMFEEKTNFRQISDIFVCSVLSYFLMYIGTSGSHCVTVVH